MKSDIQFTFDQSTEQVNFLDVCVKLRDGDITTTVYSKPTDSHLYLNSNSNHPRHVIRNIPKSQFLRLKRICSNPTDFISKSSTYAQYFISRGYHKADIERAIREVTKLKREDLLADQPKEKNSERIIFTCDWHPQLRRLPSFLKRNFFHLKNDRNLCSVFQEPPLVAFRRAKTIRKEIVRTDHSIPVTEKPARLQLSLGENASRHAISSARIPRSSVPKPTVPFP